MKGVVLMEEFARRLENLRDKFDLQQTDVSSKLGLSDNAYGNYERGYRTPDFEALIVLADLFDVSLDYLMLGKEDKKRQVSISELKSIYHDLAEEEYVPITDYKQWTSLSKEQLVELNHFFQWLTVRDQMKKENKEK